MTDRRKRFPAMAALIVFWFAMTGVAILAAFCGRESWTVIRVASLFTVISISLSIFTLHCAPESVSAGRLFFLALIVPAFFFLLGATFVLVCAWLDWSFPTIRLLYWVFRVCFVVNLIGIPLWLTYGSDSVG